MSLTLAQIFAINPTTVVGNNDLFYLVQSPYTPGKDAAILGSDLKNNFGTVTSISAGTGITLTPNPIVTTGTVALTIPVTEIHGGTNQTTYTLGDTLYSSAANTLAKLPGNITTAKQYLSQTGTGVVSAAPAWATISGGDITGAALSKVDDTNVTMTLSANAPTALLRATSMTLGWTGQLAVSRGGTGLSAVTAHDLLVGNGTSPLNLIAPSATSGVPLVSQGAAADPAFGTAVVAGGGTGLTSVTAHDLLIGNGTSPLTLLPPSATSGIPLVSQGAASDPAYSTAVVAGGGTGLTSVTAHDLLVGNGTSALNLIAPSATSGIPLVSQGASADPSFSTAVVAGGGTGNTTFTAFSVICAGTTATNPFQNVSGLGTSGQVLTSQGAGALPQWTNAPGTGTVNPGTAGQLAYYATTSSAVSGNPDATISNGALTLGIANSVLGQLILEGNTSGAITITPQAAAGTFNFNLPITAGNTGQVLQSGGGGAAAMTWSTPTYPSASGSAGKILRSDGTNNVYSTSTFADTYTASNLLYSNGANTVTGLATANSSILVTDSGGVPSLSTTIPPHTVSGNITFNPTTAGLVGTTTNDNASSGVVGEFISSAILLSSAVTATANAASNVTSISLTAGDWDVWGNVNLATGGSAPVGLYTWISSTSATLPDQSLYKSVPIPGGNNPPASSNAPFIRFSLSGTTIIYLSCYLQNGSGNGTVCGGIHARRVR